jgi:hypothetical protein
MEILVWAQEPHNKLEAVKFFNIYLLIDTRMDSCLKNFSWEIVYISLHWQKYITVFEILHFGVSWPNITFYESFKECVVLNEVDLNKTNFSILLP